MRTTLTTIRTLAALAMLAASCGGTAATEGASTSLTTTTPSEFVDPVAIAGVDDATRAEIVATLRAAIDALYAQPLTIDLEMDEEDEPVTGTIRVDRHAELVDSVEVRPTGPDSAITSRKIVVDGRAFLKSTTDAASEAALAFTEIAYEPFAPDLLDEAFTAFGRIGPSLDRWVLLLEDVPFDARTTELAGGVEISVNMSPFAIFAYYAESGLEAVGGEVHPAPTQIAFRIEEGVLRDVVAGGTHFHDGEALEIVAAISYTPIEPFALDPPSTDG
jgi:hypothetical protein